MAETPLPHQPIIPSKSPEANQQFKTGFELKNKGQTDVALTWFRRSVISDPHFFAAHMEIGYLCREKAKRDRMFLRYSYEAFRSAARLNLEHEEAHNQYIMAAQQMGVMDSLHSEYSAWAKEYPDNELIQKSSKNIITLSMAMIPPQSETAAMAGAGSLRKILLFVSITGLIAGFAFMLAPPLLLKAGKIQKEQVGGFVKIGLLIELAAVACLTLRTRIS